MIQRGAFRFVLGVSVLGLLFASVSAIAGMFGPGAPQTPEAVAVSSSSSSSTSSSPSTSSTTTTVDAEPQLAAQLPSGAELRESGAITTSTTAPPTTTTEAPKQVESTQPRKSTSTTQASSGKGDAPSGPSEPIPAGAVWVGPGQSIQSAVNSHPAGTTFVLGAGVHRRQEVKPKDGNRFVGESGAVLDGEKSVRYAFSGYASNVVIEGLVIRNYTNPPETGAVGGGSKWVVRNNEIAYNRGAGLLASDGWVVSGNNIHHNGQIGILANGAGITIASNVIANNNTDGHDPHWEAGGTKFYGQATRNLVVKNNKVRDNNGPGLWTDYVGNGTVYEGNVVTGNAGPGIFHEISGSAVIRNNHVEGNGNGSAFSRWIDGAGILVNSSRDVQVTGNVVKNNNDGIGVVDSGRKPGLGNITVKGNTITLKSGALNGVGSTTGAGAQTLSSWILVWDGNVYSGGGGQNFVWAGRYVTLDEWRAAGFDLNSTFN